MNNDALTEHLFEITEKLAVLPLIHDEVKRTNGRVTKLEESNALLAKLVSRHSGDFIRTAEEFRLLRELVAQKEESFVTEIASWRAERDKKYEEERENRKQWMDRLWLLLKWVLPLGVAATLATFGIEALPVIPGL